MLLRYYIFPFVINSKNAATVLEFLKQYLRFSSQKNEVLELFPIVLIGFSSEFDEFRGPELHGIWLFFGPIYFFLSMSTWRFLTGFVFSSSLSPSSPPKETKTAFSPHKKKTRNIFLGPFEIKVICQWEYHNPSIRHPSLQGVMGGSNYVPVRPWLRNVVVGRRREFNGGYSVLFIDVGVRGWLYLPPMWLVPARLKLVPPDNGPWICFSGTRLSIMGACLYSVGVSILLFQLTLQLLHSLNPMFHLQWQ